MVAREIASSLDSINDDFEINSDDLTDEGMTLVRLAYDKWLGRIDRGMDVRNVKLFEKALTQIRPV
ncbi:hypothetical protein ADU59_19455 [Pararhizobium polonicum]|uniref:Uncharacterized protein n=1 Tax=Pararhizobium polonicum TaxID=1612624 RepID=A0A1C7NY07_9HYPH|nr:hypothetical protein ADU59_19455 [Pararhizobium polonicum]